MIVQGSNNPLVLTFDESVDNIPSLLVTLWSRNGMSTRPIKAWTRDDMMINGETVVCPLAESETANLVSANLILEAKGLDGEGNTIFWSEYPIDLHRRRDRIITLTQEG